MTQKERNNYKENKKILMEEAPGKFVEVDKADYFRPVITGKILSHLTCYVSITLSNIINNINNGLIKFFGMFHRNIV